MISKLIWTLVSFTKTGKEILQEQEFAAERVKWASETEMKARTEALVLSAQLTDATHEALTYRSKIKNLQEELAKFQIMEVKLLGELGKLKRQLPRKKRKNK